MGTPRLPVQQEDAADAAVQNLSAGQNPRGRIPVARENSLEARPTRNFHFVARRTNECRDHRLIVPLLQPAAGAAAMAGAQSQVGLDFSAVSGPKAALIIGGTINFDQPD
eukprot:1279075-Pyramimonas_sp.AAC.1